MLGWVKGDAARLRPHVKTHKLPPVIALCLAEGITRFKASTIAECEMAAAAGGADVLLAFPLAGPNIARFLELRRRFPATRFSALTDDPDAVREIGGAALAAGVEVSLMVDLNVGMNRTGIAPGEAAAALARQLVQTRGLLFAGLHAYDGHLGIPDPSERRARWEAALAPVWALRARLEAEGISVPSVVGGGTPTLPFHAGVPGVECGAGTTVLWDFGQPSQNSELEFLNAAVLLTRVVSRPAPGRLCLDLGHKAVASEMAPPRVRLFGLEDATPVGHSEEHLILETPRAAEFPVGTVLYGLPRHVCPTVALHSEVFVVRDGRVVGTWPVVARARRITL
ncbi:MAG: D-TA family PLP-dependent enzyme [Verrucomicrobia bacterium]|nr:D-TA family PLP-dependent enzyme [Verrucomicrobiota bacterium]